MFENVFRELADHVSLVVVAEEVPHAVTALVPGPGAADLRCTLPDDLGEMASLLIVTRVFEVVHVDLGVPALDGSLSLGGDGDGVGILGVQTGVRERSLAVVGPADGIASELVIPAEPAGAVFTTEPRVEIGHKRGEFIAGLDVARIDSGSSENAAGDHHAEGDDVLEGNHFEVLVGG